MKRIYRRIAAGLGLVAAGAAGTAGIQAVDAARTETVESMPEENDTEYDTEDDTDADIEVDVEWTDDGEPAGAVVRVRRPAAEAEQDGGLGEKIADAAVNAIGGVAAGAGANLLTDAVRAHRRVGAEDRHRPAGEGRAR